MFDTFYRPTRQGRARRSHRLDLRFQTEIPLVLGEIASYTPSNCNPEKTGIPRKTGEAILFGEQDVTGSESQKLFLLPPVCIVTITKIKQPQQMILGDLRVWLPISYNRAASKATRRSG